MSQLPAWVKTEDMRLDARLDEQGRWVTGTVNELAVPRAADAAQREIVIRDDTLRSGGNTPGVYASIDKKVRIAAVLEEMGVKEAEVGYGSLADDRRFVEQLRQRDTRMVLGMHARSWLPNWKSDIDAIAGCGGSLVNFVGMQGYTMTHALHPQLNGEAFLARMEECIAYAKQRGLKVAFGSDHPRPEVMPETIRRACAAGLDRWVVYDPRGWFLPQTMAMFVNLVRVAAEDKIEVTVHAHDDFGLATAITLEGIRAGAMGCDVCVNRTGHRCGNAAFEQVAVALEYFFGYRTGIDLSKITALSQLVSELYEIPVPENAPIVGHNMFSYGGLHIPGILRGDWFLWENIRAETVGSKRHIVYGPSALQRGADSPIDAKVAKLGKSPSEAQMDRIISGLRELIEAKKFATDAEVETVISRVMG
jgi:isopropylmalate/homocitrate/citramalate synthase